MIKESVNLRSKGYIKSLQSWRAIMIIMIFILHVCPDKFKLLAGGNETISFFIILSGFLISINNYSKNIECSFRNIVNLVYRKIKKFYPLHLLMLLGCIFLSLISIVISRNYNEIFTLIVKCVLNIFLIQSFIPSAEYYFSLNGVSWYLSATLFFYVISLPMLKKIKQIDKTKLGGILLLLLISHTLIIFILQDNSNFSYWTYICPLFRSLEFLSGMLLGVYYLNSREKIDKYITYKKATLLEFTIIVIFLTQRYLCVYTNIYDMPYNYKSLIAFIISLAIIAIFSIEKGTISRLLSNRVLIYIGNISFEIYIMHTVIMNYCDIFLGILGMNKYKVILTLIVTLILAGFIHSHTIKIRKLD